MSSASGTGGGGGRAVAVGRDFPSRLHSLTGLRFWAALLVVMYHLSAQVGEVPVLSYLTAFGRTGVTFFFVLSGFVLAWTYLDRPVGFGVFMWRRFARLWPLVAATGAISLAIYWWIDELPGVWESATTFLFLQAWHPLWEDGANPASWSLSDEAFFYLLFPALLAIAAAGRRWRGALWVGCGVVLLGLWWVFGTVGWEGFWLDYFPPSRLVQFVIGVLCAVVVRRGGRSPVGYWPAVVLVVAFHAAMVPWERVSGGEAGFGPYSGSQWWSTPVFALLIVAAAQHDIDGRATLVRDRVSIRLGAWSYAWYLVHEPVIRAWNHVVPDGLGLTSPGVGVALEWVALLALSQAAAWALYSLVEHPAERWLRARGTQPVVPRGG
ncbi:acyltransferase family protein [Georgenia sp. Z1491]|uniref:acyltransferase family protein n=1 Tax=Georgenia sp. Z1491 TaxID=3416707 RepID=UPI003CF13395